MVGMLRWMHDVRCRKMGLTAAQKKAVVNSWKTLAGDAKTMQNNGANLFGL